MIETARLKLLPLTHHQLESLLIQMARCEKEVGIPIHKDVIAGRVENAIKMKLKKMSHAPAAHHNWITYWLLVIQSIPLGAGLIGFKGFPDERGCVEIGYGIIPPHRSQGYITEALKGMIDWAFCEPACQIITAPNTLKTNPASNRVLEKVGMDVYQETSQACFWKLDRFSYHQR